MKQGYRVLALFLIAAEAAAGYGLVRNFLTLPVQEERFLNGISASSLLETNSGQYGEEGTESGWTQPSEDQTAAPQSETSAPEGGGWIQAGILDARSSSQISQEGRDNSAWAAVDGNLTTSWQEGADGSGIGEWVEYDLDRTYQMGEIHLWLGNWNDSQDTDYFYGNNRPMDLRITVWEGEEMTFDYTHTFGDGKAETGLKDFPDTARGSRIRFTIESVYAGDTWDDTCIAEIGIYGSAV